MSSRCFSVKYWFYLVSLACLTCNAAFGAALAKSPDYSVRKWTAVDGLPSSHVNGIARTQDGFLWIGTSKGLARFDGVQFTTFNHENLPGLASDGFGQMIEGPDSQIYVAAPSSLTILNHGQARHFATVVGNEVDPVQVVLPVGRDEAWCGTMHGRLYHYRHGVMEEEVSALLRRASIYGLAQGRDQTLWIGTDNGLFNIVHGQVYRYQPKHALPVSGFFDLAVTDSGSVFAATNNGVLEIENDHWRLWNASNGLLSDRVNVLIAAPGDVLWIGTNAGISELEQGQLKSFETPPCDVSALSFDSEKTLWIGCERAGGLLSLRRPPVRIRSIEKELPSAMTGSIVEDKAGIVWVGTGHGLIRLENGQSRLYTEKDGLPLSAIYGVSSATDGCLWVGTENGFARMQNGQIKSFRTREAGPEDPIISILEDHSGTLWVGSSNGLLRQRQTQTGLEHVANVVGTILSIREDREGNIWASTTKNGVFRLSGNTQTQFTEASGLASNGVVDTLQADNGDIWVATKKGISRIRNDKCKSLQTESALSLSGLLGFGSDSYGHLWVRMPDGVVALDMAEANKAIDNADTLTHSRFFGSDDGFGEEFASIVGQNSIIMHSSGAMWFSTLSGIGTIDPSILQAAIPPLQPQVTSLISDAGSHDITRLISLKPGDLRIQLSYTAPSLVGVKNIEFRYQLVGFDDTWRTGGKQREAVYTSLPPGAYQFHLSVRRPFAPWYIASLPLEIRILPHFYQTWWWYSLLAVTLLGAVILIYQFRVITIRRQFSTLMSERLRERSRLARELHDTLSQGMVGISLQIEAAQVLLDVDPKSVRKHLENVGRLARAASVETRKSIAELRSSENQDPTLSAVVHKAATEFESSCTISLSTDIGEDLPRFSPEITHEISRFVEEALANVRLHSNAQHAYLTTSKSDKAFVLEVKDDGRGFKPDMSRGVPGHFGMTGMKERALRINGRFHVTTGTGEGTSVKLEVPFRAKWNSPKPYLFLSKLLVLKQRFRRER